jgi:nascent polypeptide-associated complex subunit alpha
MTTEHVNTVKEEHKHGDHGHNHGHDHGNDHHDHGHDHDHAHDHNHGEHGHVHGENCNHEHDDHDDKGAKGEKKVRKALGKLGMTKMDGVNRVTIRQKDNYILIVKDPEVYSSSQAENTFIIFGELTFDDAEKKLAREEIDKLKAEGEKLKPEVTQKPTKVEVIDENEPVSEEGLDPTLIETVMTEAKVSRQRAVKALRQSDGDIVNAILQLQS